MFNHRNNELAFFNPFRQIDDFERAFFGEDLTPYGAHTLGQFRTDIKDEGGKYVIEADLPGFRKEDITVDIDGDIMTVTAVRHSEHEDKDKQGKFIRCERSYGSYTRKFDLSNVNVESIDGKYENGVLSLDLPKKVPVAPQTRKLELK